MFEEELAKALKRQGLSYSPREFEGLIEPSLLSLPPMKSRLDEYLSDNPTIKDLLFSRLAINYLAELVDANREEKKAYALVFDKLTKADERMETPFGYAKEDTTLRDEDIKKALGLEGTVGIIRDIVEPTLYKTYEFETFNLSLSHVVYAKTSKGLYGWKRIAYKSFSNPLLSLAYAMKHFNAGGIIYEGRRLPNPNLLVNPVVLSLKVSKSLPALKPRLKRRMENLLLAYDYSLYMMNFQGHIREFREKLEERRWGSVSKVILSQQIWAKARDKLSMGIDCLKKEGSVVCSIVSLSLALIKESPFLLKPTASGYAVYPYKEEEFKLGDLILKPTIRKNKLMLSFSLSPSASNEDFLTFSRQYTIVKTQTGIMAVVV